MMKKAVFGLTVAVAVIAMAGCGSGPALIPAAKVDRPDWVLNPPQDDEKIFGIGAASSTSESRGWRMAENRARTSISYELTAIAEGMQEDYSQQAGEDGAATGQTFFQDVSRQLTASVLSGARVEKREVNRNGTYYVLVSYSATAARDASERAIREEAARNAQINASSALQAMDAAFAAKRAPLVVEAGE
jgi:predicted small lipoprotein YifL